VFNEPVWTVVVPLMLFAVVALILFVADVMVFDVVALIEFVLPVTLLAPEAVIVFDAPVIVFALATLPAVSEPLVEASVVLPVEDNVPVMATLPPKFVARNVLFALPLRLFWLNAVVTVIGASGLEHHEESV
jgi:hypothetical protein